MKDEGNNTTQASSRAVLGLGTIFIGLATVLFINHPEYGELATAGFVFLVFSGIALSASS